MLQPGQGNLDKLPMGAVYGLILVGNAGRGSNEESLDILSEM